MDINEVSNLIKMKRKNMGLSQKEFASIIGLGEHGERAVRRWENKENMPSESKIKTILSIPDQTPFAYRSQKYNFKFIDLFAGIGGIRLPFQQNGGLCVFSSEWDKFSQKTYAANFGEIPSGDITKISAEQIPDHDILLAGFPCQAFSQAGLKKGFLDTRGTMFFEIQRILAKKRPAMFLLENVKQLKGHDKGRTLKTIIDILEGNYHSGVPNDIQMSEESRKALSTNLNYSVDYKVLRAAEFGVPQNRERVYIVGFDRDVFKDLGQGHTFKWPEPPNIKTRLGDILEKNTEVDDKFTISDKLWEGHQRRKQEHKKKGNGFGYSLFNSESPYANTISARYYKDGSEILIDQSEIGKNPRKLTPRECARLQGFPDDFIVDAVSSAQSYRQFGNSVSVPVIKAIAKNMVEMITAVKNQNTSTQENIIEYTELND